jgi:uncharacterized protein (TIGR02271 family)
MRACRTLRPPDLEEAIVEEETVRTTEPASPDADCAARLTVPVVEETVELGKVAVDRGGWRITRRVESHDERIDELLHHEHVHIERRPVGLPIAEAPQTRYEGDTLVVPVLEEVLVTEKRLVLVEEVRITRVQGTHRQPETVTLRREDVAIERLEAEGPSDPEPP